MNKAAIKTDNSFLTTKVKLRIDNLPPGDLRVLDCYAGTGRIWNRIKKELPDRNIQILGIDLKKQGGIHLQGDNRKFIKSLDLTQFDIIDCDSYGVPFSLLKIIFSKPTRPGTVVFVTFIQSIFGRLPIGMLRDLGYTSKMIHKAPTLFNRSGFSKLKLWLANQGIGQIRHFSTTNKHYLAFNLKNSHRVKFAKRQTYGKVRKKTKKRVEDYKLKS